MVKNNDKLKTVKVSILARILKKKKLLTVLIVLLVIFIVAYRYLSAKKNGDVTSTQIEKGNVREELILSGEIKADEHAQLIFQSSGELDYIGVTEGDEVKKGQVLSRLDTTNLYQTLQIADANLRSAASTLDRVYDDLKGKEDSESYDEIETRTAAETAKDAAVFAHIQAQKNLANATLRAPFDGVVTNIAHPFTDFNFVFTEAQIEVVNPKTIYFEVSADQSEVIDLYLNQEVIVNFDSFPDKEIHGNIDFISYTPKQGEVGTFYKVKVKMSDDLDIKNFRIGMTGDARFTLAEKNDALYIPPAFLNSDNDGKYVNKEKKNNKVYVDVGLEGEDKVEIIGDVKEGEIVFD